MNYITTTQLRTQTSAFVEALLAGKSIDLIHRSKNLGVLTLTEKKPVKLFNAERFLKLATELNLPKTTYAEREKRYRKHLMEKYGKNLS
jgi:hypothetical protein